VDGVGGGGGGVAGHLLKLFNESGRNIYTSHFSQFYLSVGENFTSLKNGGQFKHVQF